MGFNGTVFTYAKQIWKFKFLIGRVYSENWCHFKNLRLHFKRTTGS